ncbi:DUF3893 domain-containing protein [Nocardia yunnanensis]|uniref:DUF3893 domain-containing protein n=1 Tax=Nocardia yunnanensis TaxID=2382165 RepID=A0A386ZM49_9NOCA|nr:DUF3962 domain-containing protein [Nocardia yunnanensis]AYF78526.1 DUF3893 domain-containing protein [Nocardia yunnanensis]
MVTYSNLGTAAFIPRPGLEDLSQPYYTLAFPAEWRDPVLDLYRLSRPERSRDRIKQVPIRRLNAVLKTLVPDIIAVGADASFDETLPWLYAREQPSEALMRRFVRAWLRDLNPSEEGFRQFTKTARDLDLDKLQWQQRQVDLLEHTLSVGGTRVPSDHLYRVLPSLLADKIEALPPYFHCGEEMTFKRVAIDAIGGGAELISWPPRTHTPKGKKTDGNQPKTWYYSGYIRLVLRTVPFSSIPRVHVSCGIRRWVSTPNPFTRGRAISAYLLASDPLIEEAPQPQQRFAVARLEWNSQTQSMKWVHGGPEGMLSGLSAVDNLPAPDVFVKEPDRWIQGRDGVQAALVHHAMMGYHGVGVGLMPNERRRLIEWVSQAMEPDFVLAPPLNRSAIKKDNPARQLKKKPPVPTKKGTDQEIEEARQQGAQVEAQNATIRREAVADAVAGTLSVVLLHQNDERVIDRLLAAVEDSLGLSGFCVSRGPSDWTWSTPKLSVTVHAEPLGALGAPLEYDGKQPRKGKQHEQVIDGRRKEAARRIREIAATTGTPTQLAIIVLDDKDKFKQRTTDPKFALRIGCADAGVVTQFIRPIDDSDKDDDIDHRARASWDDALRQAGMRFVPQHSLGAVVPEDLNQVAFWLVKRRVDDTNTSAQFTPIAVLIRPKQPCIMARSSEMNDWVPYPQLLTSLTGLVRPDALKTAAEQQRVTAEFIQKTLYRLRPYPTLILTHAQNTRNRWPWLQNPGMVRDSIRLGDGPLQHLTLHGRHLRIARIATSSRDETPQCWALDGDTPGGHSKGLWVANDADENTRVFYSTSGKTSTQTSITIDDSKLTPHIGKDGKPRIRPADNAWNPTMLELTMIGFDDRDSAEQWAMYLHQQRSADDYRDELGLPLALHVAQLADQYALPYDYPGETDADEPEPGGTDGTDDDRTGQLTFDFA